MPAREYRWRHLALLISILLLFIVAPFVVPLHHGILVMNVIAAAVLVARSSLTGGANHGNPGSGHGTVLSHGPDRASGWFAHRAWERSTLERLIISPPKAQVALKKPDWV
jgi:hypothetical protein